MKLAYTSITALIFFFAAPFLSSLPKDKEGILSGYTSSAAVDHNYAPPTPPLAIVLYVLCNNLQRVANPATPTSSLAGMHLDPAECANSANSASREERMECLRIMKAFSELLDSEEVPTFIQERLVVQVGINWNFLSHILTPECHLPSVVGS
jgi:hypothetical protein